MADENTTLREAVRTLLPQGFTYGEIAKKTGFTRSAVAGVVRRLNMKTGRGEIAKKTRRDNPPPKVEIEMIEVPNDPPLAGSTPTPLLETTGCRWPVEGGFCNCKVHKKPYCADHYARAYRPAAPVHPLLIKLATLGPQKPKTYAGCQAYNGLVRDRLVMFRVGTDGQSTFYLTDLGRENTPGY